MTTTPRPLPGPDSATAVATGAAAVDLEASAQEGEGEGERRSGGLRGRRGLGCLWYVFVYETPFNFVLFCVSSGLTELCFAYESVSCTVCL